MVIPILSFLGGVLIAFIGGYFTYKAGIKKLSGSVKTTEAQTLWTESEHIRLELRNDLNDCRSRIERLENQNTEQGKLLEKYKGTIHRQNLEILSLKDHVTQITEDLRVALLEIQKQALGTKGDVEAIKTEMAVIKGGRA